jgi:hypothetical protein
MAAPDGPNVAITFYECPGDEVTVNNLADKADEQQKADSNNPPFDISVLPWTR